MPLSFRIVPVRICAGASQAISKSLDTRSEGKSGTIMYDLHCHSSHSDGSLSVPQLLARAQVQGVNVLAITDHDTIAGYCEAIALAADFPDLRLISGIELSCRWGVHNIHVVGLNFDSHNENLLSALQTQAEARTDRAQLIGDRLAKAGFAGCLEGAKKLAGNAQIGRPHFAQFMVDQGYVESLDQAFKRYLGAGKTGDVKATWPMLATVVSWISDSGGIAALAHPLKYSMTATKLRALLSDFAAAGGQAVEVLSGQQNNAESHHMASLADRYGLLASVGSDFHAPGGSWSELGCCGDLPANCTPVWSRWSQAPLATSPASS